ncbi:cytochrome c-type biogenesis heme exporter protein B [Bryobacterales bacterium F-183]|nr:cytochrome c-type biogenesis heme exporter protein B [Bryobacterales bacterium F-183]
MAFFSYVWTIAMKDLRSELRTKETLNAAVSFSVAILLLFSFAFDPTAESTREFAGGLVWMVFLFASTLVLNRSFARELPNDCLDVLLASPASASAIFLGKAIASFAIILVVELLCFPVFGLFYNIRVFDQPLLLLAVATLATWAITVIGATFSALTVNLRLRELMLPVMIYPMLIPPMMAAFQLTTSMLSGEPLRPEDWLWFRMLVGFDIIFTSLAVALMDAVLVN